MINFESYSSNTFLSESIAYSKQNSLPLRETYRPYSKSFFRLFKEARNAMYVSVDEMDNFLLLETDLGETSIYENEEVYLDIPYVNEEVELNKPKRGGSKKFYVYVKNDNGNIIKVEFGDTTGLNAKINNPEAVKSFVARHDCKNKKDKTTPGYWSCNLPRYAQYLGLEGGGNYFW